jgi:hypothetical protein
LKGAEEGGESARPHERIAPWSNASLAAKKEDFEKGPPPWRRAPGYRNELTGSIGKTAVCNKRNEDQDLNFWDKRKVWQQCFCVFVLIDRDS